MPVISQGGSQVGSSNIVDGAIVNADVNTAADIEQHKLEPSQGDNTDLVSIEGTAATPHSLTTVVGQRVLIIATGDWTGTNQTATLSLLHNVTTLESISCGLPGGGATQRIPFCLQYTGVIGAATQNVSVTASVGSLSNVAINVIKLTSDV